MLARYHATSRRSCGQVICIIHSRLFELSMDLTTFLFKWPKLLCHNLLPLFFLTLNWFQSSCLQLTSGIINPFGSINGTNFAKSTPSRSHILISPIRLSYFLLKYGPSTLAIDVRIPCRIKCRRTIHSSLQEKYSLLFILAENHLLLSPSLCSAGLTIAWSHLQVQSLLAEHLSQF